MFFKRGIIGNTQNLKLWHKLVMVLAVAVVFITTYALILPAITMEKSDVQITADTKAAAFGDTLSVSVAASAGTERDESVFYLISRTQNVQLSGLTFNEDNTAETTDMEGKKITLHRVVNADGSSEFWFSLAKDEKTSFTLSFASTGTAPSEAVLSSGSGESETAARISAESSSDSSLTLQWMTEEELAASQAAGDSSTGSEEISDVSSVSPLAADSTASVDTCTVTLNLTLTLSGTEAYPVTVSVLNNSTGETVKEITITDADQASQTVVIENLPRVDADGNDIQYSVTTSKVSGYVSGITTDSTTSTNTWATGDSLWVPASSVTAGNKYMVLTSEEVGENKSAALRSSGTVVPTDMVSTAVSLSEGPIKAANGSYYSPYLKTDSTGAANLTWKAQALNNGQFAFQSDYLTQYGKTYFLSKSSGNNALSDKTNDGKYTFSSGAITGGKGGDSDVMYLFEQVDPVYGTVRSDTINAAVTYKLTSIAATEDQEYTTVRVTKSWDVPEGPTLPDSVNVTLNADGAAYVPLSGNTQVSQNASTALNTANSWTAEWKVPRYKFDNDTKTEISYSVLEETIDGYVNSIAESETDGEPYSVWVPADDFEDDTDFIIATSSGTGSVLALTANPNGSGASWLTGYGVVYPVNVVSGSVTSGGKTYLQYIEDIPAGTAEYTSTFQYQIWNADDLGTFTAQQHGTHVMYSLYNTAVNKYLINTGNASNNLSNSVTQQGRFYYNWNSRTPGKRPPSNDSSEWGNVIGSYNDYFMLSNGHIGDGGSTTAQTFFLYKKVTVTPKIKLFTITNTPVTRTDLKLHKISVANQSVSLSDVSFKLYEANVDAGGTWTKKSPETLFASGTTDADGLLTLSGIEYGKQYLLYETQAHDGYNLPDTPWRITVASDGQISVTDSSGSAVSNASGVFQINNQPGVSLPDTGSTGPWIYTLSGILLMMFTGIVYLKTKRRKGGVQEK